MILECPACQARFVVPIDALGEKGRKVKCTQCSHVWFQEPESKVEDTNSENQNTSEDTQETIDSQQAEHDNEANTDNTTHVKSPSQLYAKITAALMLVICVVTVVFATMPSLFGFDKTHGLVIYDVAMQTGDSFTVRGIIANKSDQRQTLPNVRVALHDLEGSRLAYETVDLSQATVEEGKEFVFEVPFEFLPDATASVVVDLGNSLELMRR